jgi:hypothetical protein
VRQSLEGLVALWARCALGSNKSAVSAMGSIKGAETAAPAVWPVSGPGCEGNRNTGWSNIDAILLPSLVSPDSAMQAIECGHAAIRFASFFVLGAASW